MSDLVRAMHPVPPGLQVDFLRASSYGSGTTSSGKVALGMTTAADVAGRHVLLVGAATLTPNPIRSNNRRHVLLVGGGAPALQAQGWAGCPLKLLRDRV